MIQGPLLWTAWYMAVCMSVPCQTNTGPHCEPCSHVLTISHSFNVHVCASLLHLNVLYMPFFFANVGTCICLSWSHFLEHQVHSCALSLTRYINFFYLCNVYWTFNNLPEILVSYSTFKYEHFLFHNELY